MRLHIEPYASQSERLPQSGRHILAQFDDEAIVVYQAFRPAIGHWAVEPSRSNIKWLRGTAGLVVS